MNLRSYQWILIFIGFILLGCEYENEINSLDISGRVYKTKKVIIVVIDGPRISETWAMPDRSNIPFQSTFLAEKGTYFSEFYNDGSTKTVPGHSAIVTGFHDALANNGSEFPSNPSIFQLFLNEYQYAPDSTMIITSKGKLHVLSDSKHPDWRLSYRPLEDAENRPDVDTFEHAIKSLEAGKPILSLVHFRGPDKYGHANNWEAYINAIRETDELVYRLWDFVENDKNFRDQTAMFVTYDHGRHLDDVANGFISHGDGCEGCRHISLLALGPDFKRDYVVKKHHNQTDIAPTIGELLKIPIECEGDVMEDLFE